MGEGVRAVTLTHIDLFAGIMGFSLGFERAGIETVAYVEIDKACQSVIRRHKPDALILSDVRDAGAHNLPYADIISFGSPCQDLSVAGKRKGLNGERSGLFFEAIRIIRELKPTFAVWENVPGALSAHAGRDFYYVLNAFYECGARDIAWATLDAQHFGVAQRRRRVFIVVDFRGERAGEILFVSESGAGHPQPRRTPGEGTAAPIVSRIGKGGFTDPVNDNIIAIAGTLGAEHGRNRGMGQENEASFLVAEAIDVRNSRSNGDISGTLQAKKTGGYSLNYQNPIAIDLQQVTSAANRSTPTEVVPPLTPQQQIVTFTQNEREEVRDLGDRAGALASEPGAHQQNYIAFTNRGLETGDVAEPVRAGSHGALPMALAAPYYSREAGQDRIFSTKQTAPTHQANQAGGASRNATRAGVRRLTPMECERLQAFPDGWTAFGADGRSQSDSQRYRQLGNAVCVNVAAWIGKRIVENTP